MWHESMFDPFSVNINTRRGKIISYDRGLFQLNSKSYPHFKASDFFDLRLNVRTGIAHFRTALTDNKGNIRKALYAYNAGQSRVAHPPASTVAYAKSILNKYYSIQTRRESYVAKYKENTYTILLKPLIDNN